jgi:hypothetical protein
LSFTKLNPVLLQNLLNSPSLSEQDRIEITLLLNNVNHSEIKNNSTLHTNINSSVQEVSRQSQKTSLDYNRELLFQQAG